MNHHEFAHKVIELAHRQGLLAHYCRDSRRCEGGRGFPDLVIATPGWVLFAELKIGSDETSADQDLWAWTLAQTAGPVRYRLWRRQDWLDGTIERELAS